MPQRVRQNILKSVIEFGTIAFSRKIASGDLHPRNIMLTSSARSAVFIILEIIVSILGSSPMSRLSCGGMKLKHVLSRGWVWKLDWLGLAALAGSAVWARSIIYYTRAAEKISPDLASWDLRKKARIRNSREDFRGMAMWERFMAARTESLFPIMIIFVSFLWTKYMSYFFSA